VLKVPNLDALSSDQLNELRTALGRLCEYCEERILFLREETAESLTQMDDIHAGLPPWARFRGQPLGFESYEKESRLALVEASSVALQAGSQSLETEHLLLGLMSREETAPLLEGLGVSTEDLRRELEGGLDRSRASATSGETVFGPGVTRVLALAYEELQRRKEACSISPRHLLCALVEEGQSLAARALSARGVELAGLTS